MLEYGIANENIRKILSNDDGDDGDHGDDVLPAKNQEILKIKIGKILGGHGPYAPYDMNDFEYGSTHW